MRHDHGHERRPVIVIVEDDPNIADLVELYLRRDGYRPYQASTGERALQVIAERNPELVLLDVGLPGELDGLGVCRAIRAESDIPIIFLTPATEIDRVLGLELGADDYVTKPFSPRELVARVKAILRRSSGTPPPQAGQPDRPRLGPRGRSRRREVTLAGEPIALATREFDLLHYLAEHRGLALSRLQLLDGVWGGRGSATTEPSTSTSVSFARSLATRFDSRRSGAWGTALTERHAHEAPTDRRNRRDGRRRALLVGVGTTVLTAVNARADTEADLRETVESLSELLAELTIVPAADETGRDIRARLQALADSLSVDGIGILVLPRNRDPIGSLPEGLTVEDLDTDLLRAGETQSNRDGDLLWAARGNVSRNGTQQVVVMTDEPDPLLMPSFRWFLLASLATIVVAALVAGRVSRSLTGPIRASRDVARRIAAGDLDARIPDGTAAGRDEVGELVASINSMADNLQRSNALERQFLMSVSHDLRTPLTSIKGYAEALTDGAIVDHQQAGRVIETEADRLERLVGDLCSSPGSKAPTSPSIVARSRSTIWSMPPSPAFNTRLAGAR